MCNAVQLFSWNSHFNIFYFQKLWYFSLSLTINFIVGTSYCHYCDYNTSIVSSTFLFNKVHFLFSFFFFKSSVCLFQQSCILRIVSQWLILLRTRWDALASIWNSNDAATPFRQESALLSCEGQLPTACHSPQGPQSPQLWSANTLDSHQQCHPTRKIVFWTESSHPSNKHSILIITLTSFFETLMCRFLIHVFNFWLAF